MPFYHHWVRYPVRDSCFPGDACTHHIFHLRIDFLSSITHLSPLFLLFKSAPRDNVKAMLNELAIEPYHIYRLPNEDIGVLL